LHHHQVSTALAVPGSGESTDVAEYGLTDSANGSDNQAGANEKMRKFRHIPFRQCKMMMHHITLEILQLFWVSEGYRLEPINIPDKQR
jgi:hypothetical protein